MSTTSSLVPALPRSLWLLAAVATLLSAGCKCGDDNVNNVGGDCALEKGNQPDHPGTCSDSNECGDHYACSQVKDSKKSCCLFEDRACNTEADCCPGQTCAAERKKCFDRYLACDTDEDCGPKGDRFCETWTDSYGTSKRCRFKTCGEGGTCPSGQSCFKGECLAALPCEGGCEAGKACVPSTDRCQEFGCPASCPAGFIATFKDNRDIWDTCNKPNQACECAELPGLTSDDLGRYSAIAINEATSEAFVSAYDGQYGDLVVYRFDAAGKLLERSYVDGVPSAGQVAFGPSGPRGGITEPGEDVGRYTDIAVREGRVYVSYYDATNGDLKLAIRGTDGQWTKMRVDGATADLGLYGSLALDADGRPGIAYWQRGGTDALNVAECPAPVPTGDKKYVTALKFARATSATPGPTDFTFSVLGCQSRPPAPCTGCGNVCADPGAGPDCYVAAQGCTGCEDTTETCVSVGGTPACAKKYNPANLNEVSQGTGLFPSLAFRGKEAVIAFMVRTSLGGSLYGITVSEAGVKGTRVLLDSAGDTGFFPDVKIDGAGKILVSFHDFTTRALKLYEAPQFSSAVDAIVIDTGVGPAGAGDSSWVGADSALAFRPDGRLFVVYQDATKGDLKVAARSTGWEVLTPLRTEGAVGFFADAAFLGNELFVSHARIHARSEGGEPKVDNALLLDRYQGP